MENQEDKEKTPQPLNQEETKIIENQTPENKELEPQKETTLENIVKNDFQEQTIVQIEKPNLEAIGIAADHRGYKMKQKLIAYLQKKGYEVIDLGGEGLPNDDYTEFGFKLGKAISEGKIGKGIAICGSGIGISIACNKVKGVRCAKVYNTNETKWARRDNDANAIAISGKMPLFRAKDIIDVFLKTKFKGLEKYKTRINSLNTYKD